MIAALPNIITTFRFILVVPISVAIFQGNDLLALILFALAGISDGMDGFLARRYGWQSKFGEFADPLADKCLIITTLLALAFSGRLPMWLVTTLLARDGIIVIGVLLHLLLFESYNLLPNRWGKHYTGWTIALFVIVLLRGINPEIPLFLEYIATGGVLIFIFLSITNYFLAEGKAIFKQII
ncbi:MAG: CDP-alcohol phosphatidyltransferase family protein [SAR86 cluster bacterium]|jgi:cardiolipin synthase (CMP-forming)|nr:CDP-alcohol phosphatidyltransferase family protein [SAR86 cluster bacterium]